MAKNIISVLLFILFVMCFFSNSSGQTYKIQGRVTTDAHAVINCQIDFIPEEDTTKILTVISDSNGYYRIDIQTGVKKEEIENTSVSYLLQNYPNPFIENTIISYKLPSNNYVNIKIYNILGQEVKSIKRSGGSAGVYQYSWDGRDDIGRKVSFGVYFYRIESKEFKETRKMLYLNNINGIHEQTSLNETAQNNTQTLNKNVFLQKGYYKVRISRTFTTYPLIKKKEIRNVLINSDAVLNFSLEEVKGKVVFSRWDTTFRKYFLYKINLDGSGLAQISFEYERDSRNIHYKGSGSKPGWSPDGKKIAFYSTNYIDGILMLMNEDGSNKKVLNPDMWSYERIKWSPGGDRICSFSLGEVGWNTTMITDTMGNSFNLYVDIKYRIFESDTIYYDLTKYDWYKDGKHLYIWGRSGFSEWPNIKPEFMLFLLDINSGRITKRLTNYKIYDRSYQISPNGDRYIYIDNDKIYLRSLTDSVGSNEKIIVGGDFEFGFHTPSWSNDGKFITYSKKDNYYISDPTYKIYVIDPEEPYNEFLVSKISGYDPTLFIYSNE